MRHEQGGKPNLEKWVDGVKRLGGRTAAEGDELGSLLEANEGIGHRMGRVADHRGGFVGQELTLGREEEMNESRSQRPEEPEQHPLKPAADPAELEQRRCEHDDRGLDDDVAMSYVSQFMRQHC